MAGKQTKNVFIETQYDNIVLVNPNQLTDTDGNATPRLVDHEDLVFYANLETFIIPRTKLAIGESFDNSVLNTTIASIGSDPNLKINFLQPKGKKAFDTSWSDQLTGKESKKGGTSNQKFENLTTINGRPTYVNRTEKYEDTQLLGIKNINVTVKPMGVPKVTMELVDVQGKMLFEQGENSIYSVFFNFPYPLFYLTLKGYYGKAVRYRLSLTSFNASFDSNTGNFNISLELIGKFTALLFDTPMDYARTAPKMFPTEVTIKKNSNSTELITTKTTRGRIKLDEVYQIYKRKKLIPENFPHYSIDTFLTAISNYETKLLNSVKKGDFSVLNDVERFREILNDLKETIVVNAKKNYLESATFYVFDNKKYYPFRKEISLADREKYKTKTDERIKYFVKELKNNATFGEGKSYKTKDGKQIATEINVWSKIKNKQTVIKVFPLDQWLESDTDINNTRYYRTGEKLDLTTEEGKNKLNKFKLDEKSLAPGKVFDPQKNAFVNEPLDMYYFGDKRISDGTFDPNSFLDIINDSLKKLEAYETIIDDDLSKILADRIVNGDGGLGFVPTIRNIFAIIFSGVDAFYRLMDETHQKAWDVRTDTTRLLSVIPPEKNFSVDGLNSIQTSSGELNQQNIVYPWPLYFEKERQQNGSELYVVKYPGDPKIINLTKGWNTEIWPEIHFVEEYIKGALTKEEDIKTIVYNNPKSDTILASPNSLFFPFYNLPYEDVDSVSIMYEIMERATINSSFNRLNYNDAIKKQVDLMFAQMEAQNIVEAVSPSIELQNLLREYKFTYKSFIEFLKKISNNGSGKYWNTYIQGIFNKQYIINALNEQKEVYSIETIQPTTSLTISTDTPLAENLKKLLESSETSKMDFFDIYPFNNLNWLKNNVSNGQSLNSFEDFNDTTKTMIYFDDKKTIARLNQTEKYDNIKPFTSFFPFSNSSQPYLTNLQTATSISSRQSLGEFYNQRQYKDLFFTESYIDYGNSYSGNVKSKIQTTSLLNTPYFINSLLSGVEKETNKEENAYAALGYLYLNSLPLITTKEKLKNLDENNVTTDLDYLASTIKKYSAIHTLPYAWVLKYGSIWYRYKKFVNNGVDILDDVWKDFDYKTNYDPNGSSPTTQYVIPNYTGGQETISLEKEEQIPNITGKTLQSINTGFYPRVLNSVYKFITKKDLFTGYTQGGFFEAYNTKKLKICKNNNSGTFLNFNSDSSNPNRATSKTNYYQYLDAENSTEFTGKFYILFPSMGGIPIDQSIYETVDNANNLKTPLTGNTSMYNGSVRSIWGLSHFGYFNNNLIKKPKPTEYLKSIRIDSAEQNPFDLKNNNLEYSYIDEILSVFDVDLLDKFESLFITFCNYAPTADKLLLKGEVKQPSYTDPNVVKNLKYRRLFNQISSLFLIAKTDVTITDENTDGVSMGQKQLATVADSIKKFLEFDCVIKNSNPTNFDIKLFDSFSRIPTFLNPLTFTPYVSGTLPGDGTNTTLLQSLTQNSEAWKTLREYVGFSVIPNVEYQQQVINEYPSVSQTNKATQPAQFSNTPTPNNTTINGQTMINLCTGEYFNVFDTNDVSAYGVYQDNTVLYLEVTDQSNSQKNFCVRKVPNSAITTTYNLLLDDGFTDKNLGGLSEENFCLSYYNNKISCTPSQNSAVSNIQIKLIGDSSTIIPQNQNDNNNYVNVRKPSGTYQSFKIEGDPNFSYQKMGQIKFYNANSDINDPANLVTHFCTLGFSTNYTNVCEVNGNTAGNYQLVVEYYPSAPSDYSNKMVLVDQVSTGNQPYTPTQTNNPNTSNIPPTNTTLPVPQPQLGTQKSYVSEFFIDLNIEFTSENIIKCAPLIKLYVTEKISNPQYNKSNFAQKLSDIVKGQDTFKESVLNQTFAYLNKNLPKVSVTSQTQIDKSSLSSDPTKLTTYNTLKAFNDKWIAGSDLKTRTLFEDFLFLDRANSDVGDSLIIDIDQVKQRIEDNPKQNMMQLVSWILKDNYFLFFAMPAYINFYGIQEMVNNGVPKQEITIGNDLFGTFLNVDYTNSSPKFLCQYVGNPSEWPKPKENSFIRFGDDSFDLRLTDNPLRVSDQNIDYSKNNKVVGFAVDFGIQNQNIFKDLQLDMSEKKETAETYKIYADLGNSVSGDKVAQQSVSMYSLYKTRSYSCSVECLGNAMIQPTMYFALRHVPLFYGPYLIFEVQHTIGEGSFTTKFTGTRIPKYSLPKIDNLVASVNKNVIKNFKQKREKTKPNIETEDEKKLEVDEKPTTQTSEQDCSGKTAFSSLGYVNLKVTNISTNELETIVKENTTSKILRTMVYGIGLTRSINKVEGDLIQAKNSNPYFIKTDTKYGASMDSQIKNQCCMDLNGNKVPIADFDNFNLSTKYMVSYLKNIEPMVNELVRINPNTNAGMTYGHAIAQAVYVYWDTKKGYGDGATPLTAQQIKELANTDKTNGQFSYYESYVQLFTNIFKIFS